MIGLEMPDVDRWSDRVVVALGQNPGPITGPGTNTYLVGTGKQQILIDTGEGRPEYLAGLQRALKLAGAKGIQEIILTHGHPDHIGGVVSVLEKYGPMRVSKLPMHNIEESFEFEISPISAGSIIRTEGVTLRAVYAPGHAEDHLCFTLEEEGALFSGDNILGVGSTMIPSEGGDLLTYLDSLERLLALKPSIIYPAHGPMVPKAKAKIREYIAHRLERETQILTALNIGPLDIPNIVALVYAEYPASLHAAAGESVLSHLKKLERERRVTPCSDEGRSIWSKTS
jgi:glyoxylase-like metal-dependent hydrolase (beta-lactamase superfamily II)